MEGEEKGGKRGKGRDGVSKPSQTRNFKTACGNQLIKLEYF